jgi:hypothetical protein
VGVFPQQRFNVFNPGEDQHHQGAHCSQAEHSLQEVNSYCGDQSHLRFMIDQP